MTHLTAILAIWASLISPAASLPTPQRGARAVYQQNTWDIPYLGAPAAWTSVTIWRLRHD